MTDDGQYITCSGIVSLVGATNAGKSTLVNQLIGEKVSIVTHKVQTTRTLVRGIFTHKGKQIVLVDTPGIFNPGKQRDRAMVSATWNSIWNTDILLLIVDVKAGLNDAVAVILAGLAKVHQPKVLVLNKIDRITRPGLLALAAAVNEKVSFERTFMISALNGSGCYDVLNYLEKILPVRPWYYPENQRSDMPIQQFAAEITREKLYLRLHDELPYTLTVEAIRWEECKDNSVCIEQIVYVEQKSQKKILLGHKGCTIKVIGQTARQEISKLIKRHVHLFLFVKVRHNWSKKTELYHKIGRDFSA